MQLVSGELSKAVVEMQKTGEAAGSTHDVLEAAIRTAVTNIKAQASVANQYARDAAPKDHAGPTVWELQNSHFGDIARELEAALARSSVPGVVAASHARSARDKRSPTSKLAGKLREIVPDSAAKGFNAADIVHVRASADMLDAMQEVLRLARQEYYDATHSHMSDEQIRSDPVLRQIDAALKLLDAEI
jgi:hypothetical protein